MYDFRGQVAIVTGTSSGIGLATTRLFLERSAHVFGVDLSPVTDADLSKLAQDDTSAFHFHKADLTDPGAAKDIVQACLARFGGRIDILANVAGIMDRFASADAISDEFLDRILDVNLKAPVKLMGAVIPTMIQQKRGTIVNVSSVAGLSGADAGLAYTASKHGLVGATKNVAVRYKDHGITCNSVAPAGVATNILKSMDLTKTDMTALDFVKTAYEAFNFGADGGLMPPDTVAESILFLASGAAKFINGVVLPIDKGFLAA